MEKRNNYDIAKVAARKEFLACEQEEPIRRLNLKHDAENIYVTMLNREYRIERMTGAMTENATGRDVSYSAVMTAYDAILGSKKDAFLSGRFCTVNQLKGVVQTATVSTDLHNVAADRLDRDHEALIEACEALGGVKTGFGDVGYRFQMFDFLPVLFEFWFADEDFPASVQFKWDENLLSYLRYETAWFAMGHVIERLEEEIRNAQERRG